MCGRFLETVRSGDHLHNKTGGTVILGGESGEGRDKSQGCDGMDEVELRRRPKRTHLRTRQMKQYDQSCGNCSDSSTTEREVKAQRARKMPRPTPEPHDQPKDHGGPGHFGRGTDPQGSERPRQSARRAGVQRVRCGHRLQGVHKFVGTAQCSVR